MDCVTVLGPLWLLFYGFFKVKLFNLEKVQGRKIRRLALTLVEKVAAQFSLKNQKRQKKKTLSPQFYTFHYHLTG